MALSVRAVSVASVRPAPRSVRSVRPATRSLVVVKASPKGDAVEQAIKEAEIACEKGNSAGACAAAWDNVEEISAAISHKKVAEAENSDPLEKFCDDNPDADECRVYDE